MRDPLYDTRLLGADGISQAGECRQRYKQLDERHCSVGAQGIRSSLEGHPTPSAAAAWRPLAHYSLIARGIKTTSGTQTMRSRQVRMREAFQAITAAWKRYISQA